MDSDAVPESVRWKTGSQESLASTESSSASLRVLVVDDDPLTCVTTAKSLRKGGYDAHAVQTPMEALERAASEHWDVVLTDLRMPGMNGIEFMRKLKEAHPRIDVILMTACATVETVVEALRSGATDYLVKPFGFEAIKARLERSKTLRDARNELARLNRVLDDSPGLCGIVGRSEPMQEVYDRIETCADQDIPILVTGETGTGKELVARALHKKSSRAKGPFVAIACGTIPGELAESELFGHENGSFTGASSRREGKFLRAEGGTILLDDIDDLPLEIQPKLLRVLQEGTIQRVGGTCELNVDVRVIATTKVNLVRQVEKGKFRADLYYRLCGPEIALPPLRDRGDDVLLLAQHFLNILASRTGRPLQRLGLDVAQLLRAHSWPGNVRELRRSMESAFILVRGELIRPEHLPNSLHAAPCSEGCSGPSFSLHLKGRDSVDFNELRQGFELALIRWALSKTDGKQWKAAEMLGLPKSTLQSKVHRRPLDAGKS